MHMCVWKTNRALVRRSGSFVYPGAWGVSGVCFVLRDDWSWSSFISFQPSCLWGPPDGLQTPWDPLEFSQVWGLSGKPFINTLHCRRWKLPGHFYRQDLLLRCGAFLISYSRLLCLSQPNPKNPKAGLTRRPQRLQSSQINLQMRMNGSNWWKNTKSSEAEENVIASREILTKIDFFIILTWQICVQFV